MVPALTLYMDSYEMTDWVLVIMEARLSELKPLNMLKYLFKWQL